MDLVHRRRWLILGVMCLSLIMVVLGNSVLNVALPTLATELSATNADLQWIVDSYALVFGGLLLTMGAVGDRFGRRGALMSGLAIVGAGSIVATFATTSEHLIATRAVMGLGAALVMPATLSIISHVFPPEERGKAMGIWAAFAGIGGAIGPVVGGALLERFAWSSIFWLNVPVVALAILGGILIVPTSRDPEQHRLDIRGAALSVVALASLLFAIIEGPAKGWTSVEVLIAFAIAALAWPLFILWERRAAHPMLPLGLFRRRGFSMGNLAIALSFFVMFAFFFGMTQYLQFVRGFTALQAGVRTLPLAAGLNSIAAPRSDALVRRIGTPGTVTTGLGLVAVSLLAMSFIGMDTAYWFLAIAFVGLGLGMGFAMAPSTTLVMDDVPGGKAGVGSAMNDTSREVGGAFGIAVLGSIVNEVYQARIDVPAGTAGPLDPSASLGNALQIGRMTGNDALIESARLAFVDGIGVAYMIGAAVALLSALAVRIWMPRRADLRADKHEAGDAPVDARPPMVPAPRSVPARSVSTPGQDAAVRPVVPTLEQRLADMHARMDALERGALRRT